LCWDGFRKSNKPRDERPEDYDALKPKVKELVTWLFGIDSVISDEHEAYDLLATLVANTKADEVYVVSGDKDLSALIGFHPSIPVHFYDLQVKDVVTPELVCQRWNVHHPNQVSIALAILGDKIDGIAGIHGYGPKKVQSIFANVPPGLPFAETLERVDAQIPEKHKEAFYSSLEATMLYTDASGLPEPKELTWRYPGDLVEAGLDELVQQYSYVAGADFGNRSDADGQFNELFSQGDVG